MVEIFVCMPKSYKMEVKKSHIYIFFIGREVGEGGGGVWPLF